MALLEFRDLSKSYGNLKANDGISLRIEKNQIHGLVGENGAGKSTLMKMLFGLERPTSGKILLRGEEVSFTSPQDAREAGIGMVHQHFMQAGQMRALDHFLLDHRSDSWWKNLLLPLPVDRLEKRIAERAEKLGMSVPWRKSIEDLGVGYQQRVEILRLLDQGAEILILDEPTAILSPSEVETLLQRLKFLQEEGKTVLLISHKLAEVKAVCSHVSVLRQGRLVWTGAAEEKSDMELAELMVGHPVGQADRSRRPVIGKACLEARALSSRRRRGLATAGFTDFSLTLREGEIVGLAGVEGNGQSELLEVLAHPAGFHLKGEIRLFGKPIEKATNRQLRGTGVAYLAEDRLRQSLCPDLTVTENFLLGHQHDRRWVEWSEVSQEAAESNDRMDVRPRQTKLPMRALSGGNQQKFVVGRETHRRPKVLIAAHPTRGVDLHASEKIHDTLLDLRDQGTGIFLVSSDLDELFHLSDRLLVISRGRIVREFRREDFDRRLVGAAMGGLEQNSPGGAEGATP